MGRNERTLLKAEPCSSVAAKEALRAASNVAKLLMMHGKAGTPAGRGTPLQLNGICVASKDSKGGMVMNQGRSNSRARMRSLLSAGLAFVMGGSWAIAHDGRWVTADGRKIGLTRSKSELAVKLRNRDDADAYGRRIEAADLGKLQNFKRAPAAHFKIVSGKSADRAQADRLRRDPVIEEVQHVYRFDGIDSPLIGTQTIMVKVNRGISEADVRALWQEFGIVQAVGLKGQRYVYEVEVPQGQDEILLAEALADDPRTKWSQPNFRREVDRHQITPSDQFFSYQWHLNNTGQQGGQSGADIDALEAWNIATGKNVIVGSFDDAVDVDHEDLRDNYIGTGHDVTLVDTADGYDDPRPKRGDTIENLFGNRHGTATMGLIAARANNRGGRGVAFDAKFTASRGLNDLPSDSQVAGAFVFARDNNVGVHNNSWSFGETPDPAIIADALAVAYATGRNSGDLDGDGDDDPLGMLAFFSSGNSGSFEYQEGQYIAALPYVMAIGSSNDHDERSLYSSFGPTLSVLAPSDDYVRYLNGLDRAFLFTTDNTDTSDIDQGYNVGEFSEFLEEPDSTGNYTAWFGGTSGACPVAVGVAALCLSANPNLTAIDLRMLIEHTADKIEPQVANYDPITSHSLTHGYGRVNAGGAGEKLGAVEAAKQALTNGGHTWPDRPADLVVDDTTVRWIQGSDTMEFLVVQGDGPFGFVPTDGSCYDPSQTNCTGEMQSLPGNTTALAVGCGLACSGGGFCEIGAEQCLALPQGKNMAVYARNAVGRYSFGVEFDSAGNVNGSGKFLDLSGVDDIVIPTGPPDSRPQVTINVSPLEGDSPLTVNFQGNAVSTVPIDSSRTSWDFDLQTPPESNASTRNASYVYEVPSGQTRTFIAKLTMYDSNGVPGSEEVAIQVRGPGEDSGNGGSSGSLDIIVGLPNTPDSNVSSGKSPFHVVLSVDATGLPGTLQGISWDLGDGSTSSSLVVPHSYINEGTTSLRIPITATVTTATSSTTTVNTSATRIITVEPGTGDSDPDVDDCELPGTCAEGDGGSASACGATGMLPLLLMFATLTWMRRKNG